jgi:cell division protein FtsW (lipid II flippase)
MHDNADDRQWTLTLWLAIVWAIAIFVLLALNDVIPAAVVASIGLGAFVCEEIVWGVVGRSP